MFLKMVHEKVNLNQLNIWYAEKRNNLRIIISLLTNANLRKNNLKEYYVSI